MLPMQRAGGWVTGERRGEGEAGRWYVGSGKIRSRRRKLEAEPLSEPSRS